MNGMNKHPKLLEPRELIRHNHTASRSITESRASSPLPTSIYKGVSEIIREAKWQRGFLFSLSRESDQLLAKTKQDQCAQRCLQMKTRLSSCLAYYSRRPGEHSCYDSSGPRATNQMESHREQHLRLSGTEEDHLPTSCSCSDRWGSHPWRCRHP